MVHSIISSPKLVYCMQVAQKKKKKNIKKRKEEVLGFFVENLFWLSFQ